MELYIPIERPQTDAKNGQFLKGHVPFNKGKKWSEYLKKSIQKKMLKIGAKNLRIRHDLGGWNKKKVVAIKDAEFFVFDSITQAAKIVGSQQASISRCCRKLQKRTAGYYWFYEDDNAWCEMLEQNRNKIK